MWLLSATALLLLAEPGCDDGKPSIDTSLTEATVSGVISVKGEPATGGVILFNPSKSGRIVQAKSATIGPDGHYTIKTYTGDNQVSFGGEIAEKNRGLGLAKHYASVKSGENEINFDLMGGNNQKGGIDLSKKGTARPKKG